MRYGEWWVSYDTSSASRVLCVYGWEEIGELEKGRRGERYARTWMENFVGVYTGVCLRTVLS